MSTYFGMSAIVAGDTHVIRQLHALVIEDETKYRSDAFRCKEVAVGKEGMSAFLYHAGRSRCRPASVHTLQSKDAHDILNGQAVCEYLYTFAESAQDAYNECEFKGTVVGKGNSDRRGTIAHVDQVFVQKCRELGVDADALFKQLTTTAEDGEDPRGPEPVRPEEPIEGSMGDELPTEAVLSDDDGDDDFPF